MSGWPHARDVVLDPRLDALRECADIAAARRDRRADRQRDGARPIAPQALGPPPAGVVRDREQRHAELAGETAAARLVARPRAGADARALGIDHDPEALPDALAALRGDLRHRIR